MAKTKFSKEIIETLEKIFKVSNEIYFKSDSINVSNEESTFIVFYNWDKSLPKVLWYE